jgi:hypothetical protein
LTSVADFVKQFWPKFTEKNNNKSFKASDFVASQCPDALTVADFVKQFWPKFTKKYIEVLISVIAAFKCPDALTMKTKNISYIFIC